MSFDKSLAHLKKVDPVLYELGLKIKRLEEITPRSPSLYFEDLCESIVSQQLSIKAADTIWNRVKNKLNNKITPDKILSVSDQELRDCGLSWAKVSYIKDLAKCTLEDKIKYAEFETLSNEEIIKELVQVKGIGLWTAEMFLIFTLGKPDVFSEGDLGLKNAIKKLKGLKNPKHWSPYRSYASRILWKSLEL